MKKKVILYSLLVSLMVLLCGCTDTYPTTQESSTEEYIDYLEGKFEPESTTPQSSTEASIQVNTEESTALSAKNEEKTSATSHKEETIPAEPVVNMDVHFIDVGQGDSTLIINGDHAMLIDAGDNSKGTTVQLYLKKQGIEKLDYLILTHTDADHIGGADVIITKYDIDTVFMGDFPKDNATYRDVLDALKNKSMSWSTPAVGDTYTLGDASFTIVAPNGSYDTPNNTSIGLLLTKGENKFLFTGDAEEEAEKDMLDNGLSLDADVYQVGHHGSKTASSQKLLDAVTPTYAVISCAEGNKYGHPHSQTLNNLRAMKVQVFRTDEQGSIVATSDGTTITWNCAASETWQAGESTEKAEEKKTDTPKTEKPKEEAPKADPVVTPEPAASSSEMTYICNTNTHKFHYPDCSSVKRMADKNKKEVTTTREDLISQGYDPCQKCNP